MELQQYKEKHHLCFGFRQTNPMVKEQSQFLNNSDIMDTQEIWADSELYKDSQVKDSKGYIVSSSVQNYSQGSSGNFRKHKFVLPKSFLSQETSSETHCTIEILK